MKESLPYVITLSRMLGSGGVVVGKQLAEKLNINYFDKEILIEAAGKFGLQESDLIRQDEKKSSVWELFLRSSIMENPELYAEAKYCLPSDRQLFETEGEIIKSIANDRSAVVIGRGGVHFLKDHPRHISVFLHCDTALRIQRIRDLFQLSEKDAERTILNSDVKRSQYYHTFTGREWTDARQYTLSIDTGIVSLDKSAELVIQCVKQRFL